MNWTDAVPGGRRLPPGVEFPTTPGWPVTLRHREVVLRPLRRGDRGRWDQVRHANHDWLRPWDATAPRGSNAGAGSFAQVVRRQNEQGRSGLALPWLLAIDPDPRLRTPARDCPLVGQVSVGGILYGSARWASIGYWIDQASAGHGYVPRGVALAMDYCFQVLGLHRIEVNVRPENTNSLRVVQKLGLRHEGRRAAYLHIDGDWRDHECFALHADEVPEGVSNRLLSGGAGPVT